MQPSNHGIKTNSHPHKSQVHNISWKSLKFEDPRSQMDPKGSQGPGGDGEAPAAPAVGRGRAQLLRNLSQRESSVASQALSTTASAGRGILLRGLSTDSTLGDSSITSQGPPPTVAGGRGALLKQLSGGGGPSMTSASSAATSSATARQELMAKIQNSLLPLIISSTFCN